MNEQQNDNTKSYKKLEKLIILLSVLLVFFCLLSVLLLVKMYKMDNTLNRLSYIISNETEEYENKDIIDVFVEESNVPETLLPLYDESYSEQTQEQNTVKEKETNNTDTSNSSTNKSETNSNDEPVSNTIEDTTSNTDNSEKITYAININSKKMHYSDCSFVGRMKEENKQTVDLSKSELKNYLNNGYTFCSTCGG